MKHKLILSVCIAISIFKSTAHGQSSEWSEAYSCRSYHLGITLVEFKSLKHPDEGELSRTFKNMWSGSYAACSDDSHSRNTPSGASLYGPLKEVGVVRCLYYYELDMLPPKKVMQTSEMRLTLADIPVKMKFYFIKPESKNEYYLYEISGTALNMYFEKLRDAYTSKFGSPADTSTEILQNRLGAQYENIIVSWENDISSIKLEKYHGEIDKMGVSYVLKPLNTELMKRLNELSEGNADKL